MRRLPLIIATAITALAIPAVSTAETPAPQAMQQVSYHGYDVTVPASWRVVDLDSDPSACVIFDTSTAYVGRAGSQQDCPAHAVSTLPRHRLNASS